MKKIYTTPLLICTLLTIASCDTIEDAYYPGPMPTDVLSVNVAEVRLNADGTPQDVGVTAICYWDASLTDNQNVFNISSSTNRGDGVVSVGADSNYGSGVKTATLVISARNFNKDVTVNVMQSSLTFEMAAKDYPATPEQGGSVDLKFDSSTGWTFVVQPNGSDPNDVGSLDWLEFTPGVTGDGSFYETTVTATWKPNYTTSPRMITLVLRPLNEDILNYLDRDKLPQPFALVQEAGTRVREIAATVGEPDYHGCDVTISYKSTAPVTDAGIKLYESEGTEVGTFSAEKVNGDYPASGQVTVHLSDLKEGMHYIAQPFVASMVGVETGESVEFTTKSDEVVYNGVSISNYDIISESRSVSVGISMESDIEISECSMSVYEMNGDLIDTYTAYMAPDVKECEITSKDILTPNTEYQLKIFAKTSVNEVETDFITFTTKGLSPDEDDNETPE